MAAFFPADSAYSYRLGAPDLCKAAAGLGADAYEIRDPGDFVAAWSAATRGAAEGRPQVIVAKIDRKASPPYWSPPFWQKSVD
jgi:acetolactate synthase I/II/III large subunit